jgi:hypothetical protein
MSDGTWIPCWQTEFLGSTKRSTAVMLRRNWFAILVDKYPRWKPAHLKTIKVKPANG